MPNQPFLEAPKSPFEVSELIQVIYGFFKVSEVLKLRLTSRKFNQAALQTQEDLVDGHRASTALNILLTQSKILSSAWIVDLPMPSILSFFIKNSRFETHLRTQHPTTALTASSEVRHLLVMMDTLKTPERRDRYFSLIEQQYLTATEFCQNSISSMTQFLLIQTIHAVCDSLFPKCTDEHLLTEKKELLELITTYYESTSDTIKQEHLQKEIREKVLNLLHITEYKFMALLSIPFLMSIFIAPIIGILFTAALFNYFYQIHQSDQRLNQFYALDNLESRYRAAEPHMKELGTLVSEMGMFKNRAILDEDESRQKLSHRIQASAS